MHQLSIPLYPQRVKGGWCLTPAFKRGEAGCGEVASSLQTFFQVGLMTVKCVYKFISLPVDYIKKNIFTSAEIN